MKRADPRAALRNLHDATLAIAGDKSRRSGVFVMRLVVIASLTALAIGTPSLAQSPVQVMIVGTYHMSNPGRDMHDVKAGDVLSPKRQGELSGIVNGIARFNPGVVDVEWDAATTNTRYKAYIGGTLPPSHNEVVQLGFRLAMQQHLASVNGIDVEGEFPYDAVEAFAKAHGEMPLLTAADSDVEAFTTKMDAVLARGTIGDALRYMNDPALVAHGNDFYRTTLKIGAGAVQPGADLLAAWYKRNLYICANLIQSAHPGDRVVVFYGSGHAFLLHQCVSETPGFRLVEANDYLPK
jgi:hypothetical protein